MPGLGPLTDLGDDGRRRLTLDGAMHLLAGSQKQISVEPGMWATCTNCGQRVWQTHAGSINPCPNPGCRGTSFDIETRREIA